MTARRFRELVGDYLGAAGECLDLFEQVLGRRDPIVAWRQGIIPQTGTLKDTLYEFHGYGCLLTTSRGRKIDFEFADRELIGFDDWRLWRFARQQKYGRRLRYATIEALGADLLLALEHNVITKARPSISAYGNSQIYTVVPGAWTLRSRNRPATGSE